MTTETKTLISDEDAEYARSLGFFTGADAGYSTRDLWINPRGTIHITPFTRWGKTSWVAAFIPDGANVPISSDSYWTFRRAIKANA
jgi:hypothetical protein